LKTSKWDIAEALDDKEDIITAIEVALADNDTKFLFSIVSALARSEGMTQIARELGVTRESLYKSLSPDGNPSFATIIKLLNILGMRLSVKPIEQDSIAA
jgi:probable addiction module antidote protein